MLLEDRQSLQIKFILVQCFPHLGIPWRWVVILLETFFSLRDHVSCFINLYLFSWDNRERHHQHRKTNKSNSTTSCFCSIIFSSSSCNFSNKNKSCNNDSNFKCNSLYNINSSRFRSKSDHRLDPLFLQNPHWVKSFGKVQLNGKRRLKKTNNFNDTLRATSIPRKPTGKLKCKCFYLFLLSSLSNFDLNFFVIGTQ